MEARQPGFEDAEILCKHIPIVHTKIDSIRSKICAIPGVLEGNHDLEFPRLEKIIGEKVDKIFVGATPNVTVPTEVKTYARMVSQRFFAVITEVDYCCGWLMHADAFIKKISEAKSHMNIRDEGPLAERMFQVFNCYTRIGLAFHFMAKWLNIGWHALRMSCSDDELSSFSTPAEYVDVLLGKLFIQPFKYLSSMTKPLHSHIFAFANTILSFFTQIFGTFSNVDWAFLATEGAGYLDSESSLIHTDYILLQNIYLFRTTLAFFVLMCPEFFSDSVAHESLVVTVLSESAIIRITQTFTVPIESLYKLGGSTYQKKVLTSITRDIEQKMISSHVSRVACLTNIIDDYIEKVRVDPDILALYFDQILSIISFSVYEIIMCSDNKNQKPKIGNLLLTMLRLLEYIEMNKKMIQRTFIYTLWEVDRPYLSESMQKCQNIGQFVDEKLINLIKRFCGALGVISLDEFDQGMRYDFMPFFLTHGRIAFNSFLTKQSDLSYLGPLLEHLKTIINHTKYIESPMKAVLDLVPINEMFIDQRYVVEMIKDESIDIELLPSIFTYFRCIQPTKSKLKVFNSVIETVLGHFIQKLNDAVSPTNSNVVVSQQDNYNVDFDVSKFLYPAPADRRKVYLRDATQMSIVTKVAHALRRLPTEVEFFNQKVPLSSIFAQQFKEFLSNKITHTLLDPQGLSATIGAIIQSWKPILDIYNISYTKIALQSTNRAVKIPGDGVFGAQAKVFACTEKLSRPGGFLDNYLTLMEKFMNTGHRNSEYEPLRRTFISAHGAKLQTEIWFGVEPMKSIISTWGIRAGMRIDNVILRSAYECIRKLVQIYGLQEDTITSWYAAFQDGHVISIDARLLMSDSMREASDEFLRLGVIATMRKILSSAIYSVLDDAIPGLLDIINFGIEKTKSPSEEEYVFMEAIRPGLDDKWLKERVKKQMTSLKDPHKFFFFLSMLFMNPNWSKLKFYPENDHFTHNLQLTACALETVMSVAPDLFKECDVNTLNTAVASFFNGAAVVADIMKGMNRDSYLAFMILIDHFPAFSQKISYGHMKNAFPFGVIRACYNELASKVA